MEIIYNNYRNDGLVDIYRIGPVSSGKICHKNGIKIQRGRIIDENDSILFGEAVVFDLHKHIEEYTNSYIKCSLFMSIDDYMNRARNEDCFYALSPISDEYVALDKFYLMLEASIREKYGDFDKMSKGEKRRFLRQNAADEDIPY